MIVILIELCLCLSLYVSLIWKRREVLIQVDAHIRMNYTNGNAEGSGGYGYEQGYTYSHRHHDIGVNREKCSEP